MTGDFDDEHADPAEQLDQQATRQREQAVIALQDGDTAIAIARALLALEARLEELTYYVAGLG